MPTNLFVYLQYCIKSVSFLILLLLFPVFFYGQTLTGLWTGAISNDSNTVRKDQSFEIALTEYKGKVYGYSRTEFIVEDVLYYVMKRVKGTIDGDVCEVEDDEIISFNFPTKLDKGVKVTSTFRRNKLDNIWQLEGTWKTNATKKYYAVTGSIDLEEEKDLTASKIFPHLEELKLANDIAFYKEREDGIAVVKLAKPEKIKSSYAVTGDQIIQQTESVMAVTKPTVITTTLTEEEELPVIKKNNEALPKTKTNSIPENIANVKPATANTITALNKPPVYAEESVVKKETAVKTETFVRPDELTTVKKENPIVKNSTTKVAEPTPTIAKKTTTQAETKKEIKPTVIEKTIVKNESPLQKQIETVEKEKIVVDSKKPMNEKEQVAKSASPITPLLEPRKTQEEITASAAIIYGRTSTFTQEVNYQSDSLVLSLYDNGEIDGDTVSVYMNGEVIMSRQGLKATAIKKTIYISPESEDFSLVLFAENLGKYPPNTGLLVVRDGDEVYNLRFSSDFKKNAGIIFRRKK